MRAPSYIVKHTNGIYYFRYVIPRSIQHLYPNRREIRRSLGTRSYSLALKLARIHWVNIVTKISPDELDKQISDWETSMRNGKRIHDELAKFEDNYQSTYNNSTRDEYIAHISTYDSKCLEAYSKHQQEKTVTETPTINTLLPNSTAPLTTADRPLLDLFDLYLADKGSIQEDTKNGYKRHFKLFLRITQISNLNELNVEHVRHYKSTLPKLPPNIQQNKKLTELSIKQILAKKHDKTLSEKSIKLSASLIQSFLHWLFIQQYLTIDMSGPLHAIKTRSTKKDNEYRAVFTSEDLNLLFAVNDYQKLGFRKYSFRYWVPLLGLFTGARINEISQLLLCDVTCTDGIYVIDINNKNGKKAKTKSARRRIPIHKTLIQLGFDDYITHIKSLGEKKLFPALVPDKNGVCSRKVSRFFNEQYKNNQGLVTFAGIQKHSDHGVKVFHSFRHTFTNQWKQQLLNDNILKQVIGHSSNDITLDRYGKPYDIKLVSNELNNLDFNIENLPIKWLPRFYR